MVSKTSALALSFLILFIVSLGVRLIPLIEKHEPRNNGLGIFGDSYLYHLIANNLAKGNGFIRRDDGTTFGRPPKTLPPERELVFTRGPVYPLFVAGIYKFLTSSDEMKSPTTWTAPWRRIRFIQCILDSFTCILVMLILRALLPHSILFPIVGGLMYAFSVYNIYYTRAILTETVMTFLVTSMVLSMILWLKKPTRIRLIIMGIFSALVPLCRPEYLPFSLVWALWIVYTHRNDIQSGARIALAYLAVIALVLMPWTIRNYKAFNEFIPITIGGSNGNLYLGTWVNPETWAGWKKIPDSVWISEEERQELTTTITRDQQAILAVGTPEEFRALDRLYKKWTWKRIQARPREVLTNWIRKIPRLWYQDYIPMYKYLEASGNFFIAYFILGLIAFFRFPRESRPLLMPIILPFLYLNILFLPAYVEPRYGVALMPSLIALASITPSKLLLHLAK